MTAVEQFILISQKLMNLLETDIHDEQREKFLNEINDLLNQRKQLLSQFPPQPNMDERAKTELMELEQVIQSLMKNQKELIKRDIKTLQVKKRNNNQYANPYDNLSIDGMFLDRKK